MKSASRPEATPVRETLRPSSRKKRYPKPLLAGFVILLTALAASPGDQPKSTVTVSMVAVQATNEGRKEKFFGPGLEEVYKAVIGLDYDTFHRVKATEVRAPYNRETKLFINDRYTLYVKPVEQGEDGRIRLQTRITIAPKKGIGDPINALNTTLAIAPGKHLNLGGLRLAEGELIVVLSVKD